MSHAHGGTAGPGGTGHGGHPISAGEDADQATEEPTSVATNLHTHDFTTNITGEEYTILVGSETHKHEVGTYAIGQPVGDSTSVALAAHTHPPGTYSASASVAGTTNAVTALGTAQCTAANCTKTFYACITSTIAVIASNHAHSIAGASGTTTGTGNVASSIHTHTLTGSSDEPSFTVTVADYDHVHPGTTAIPNTGAGMLISLDALHHTHPIAGKATDEIGDVLLPEVAVMINSSLYNDVKVEIQATGSTPEMYLAVELDGTPITGSPFVIGEAGAYSGDEISDSVGPVSIADDVLTTGEHTIGVGLTNKTSPGDPCKIMASVRINGRFFVSTIAT